MRNIMNLPRFLFVLVAVTVIGCSGGDGAGLDAGDFNNSGQPAYRGALNEKGEEGLSEEQKQEMKEDLDASGADSQDDTFGRDQ